LDDSDADEEDNGTEGVGMDSNEDPDWLSALPQIEKGSPEEADVAHVSRVIAKV
jgi:hypothetical protein